MRDENVTVIIVNYRSVRHIGACLAALTSEVVTRIVVVDNDSGSDEVLALKSLAQQDRRITLLTHHENIGFGPAVNLAVAATTWAPEDHLWILNPDTVSEPDAPDRLSACLRDGGAEIVSPLITMGEAGARKVWFAGGAVDPDAGVVSHAWSGAAVESVPQELHVVNFLTGAAPMMSHRTWARLGGFREDLFLYWEDVDLSLRASRLGLRQACLPTARVWHLRGGSSGATVHSGRGADFYYYTQRNRILVCRETAGVLRLVLGRGAVQVLRVLAKVLLVESEGRPGKLRAAVAGLVHGVRGIGGPRG